MENSGTLRFTLGDDAGKLIMEIALENLTIKYDIEHALSMITGCLIDCPNELALDILVGKKIIIVNDDHSTVSVIERDQEHDDYPKLDIRNWIGYKVETMHKDACEICDLLFDVAKDISEDGTVNVSVDILSVIHQYESDEYSELLNDIISLPEIDRPIGVIEVSNRFIEKAYKVFQVFRFLKDYYPSEWEEPTGMADLYSMVQVIDQRVRTLLSNSLPAITAMVGLGLPGKQSSLERYLVSSVEISKTIEDGIMPVDICDRYDAGWLSPKGVFYGMNGEIANMLHIQIADALQEKGIIPSKEEGEVSADGWMSRNGWVKIHHDWILYDGYEQAAYGLGLVPLTEAQIHAIAKYGNACYGGSLRFGIRMVRMSAALFETCDEGMRARLLDYEGVIE